MTDIPATLSIDFRSSLDEEHSLFRLTLGQTW